MQVRGLGNPILFSADYSGNVSQLRYYDLINVSNVIVQFTCFPVITVSPFRLIDHTTTQNSDPSSVHVEDLLPRTGHSESSVCPYVIDQTNTLSSLNGQVHG